MSRYFCHSCQEEVDGNTLESGDIQCCQCSGDFLELLGQDVESFIGNHHQTNEPTEAPQANSTSSTTSSSQGEEDNMTNLLLPGLINQLLGGSLNSASPLSLLSQSNTETAARPIGILVRQTAMPGDDFLSAILGRSFLQRGLGGGGSNSFEDLLHHIMMNESSYANQGASEGAIARLERRTENLHELGECSISQETFTEGDTAIVLSCHHAFKENEILQWLRVNKTCPVCRVSIE